MDDRYPTSTPPRTETYMVAKTATDLSGNQLTFSYQSFGKPIAPWTMPGMTQLPILDWATQSMPDTYPEIELSNIENPATQLTRVASSDGRVVDFLYDQSTGRLRSISNNAGASVAYGYLSPDRLNSRVLNSVTYGTGEVWKYGYFTGPHKDAGLVPDNHISLDVPTVSARKISTVTYPSGGVVSYTYSGTIQHVSLSYGGNRWRLTSAGEQVSSRTLSTGEGWSYTYQKGTSRSFDVTTITGPEGKTVSKYVGPSTYASLDIKGVEESGWQVGTPIEKTDPLGNVESQVWQPRTITAGAELITDLGYVLDSSIRGADLQSKRVVRDGLAYTTQFSNYDSYGNAQTKVEIGPNGEGRTTSLTYFNDPAKWIIGKISSEVSPGMSLTRTFDANGNVLTETRNGVTTSFTYDVQGNIANTTFPGGRVYTYSNYKRGIAQTEIRPESVTLTRVVDNAGNIITETNGEGRSTSYTYDGLNRQTSFTPPVGNPQTTAYSATSKTTTRGARVERIVYDPFGRPASVSLGGITRTFTHDGLGRKTFESDPSVSTGTRYQYDALDRLTRQTNADGTFQSRSYGPANMSVVDERGKTTTYTYRAYGDPDKQLLMAITAPEASANVSIERSPNGLMTAVTQAGLKRTYGYDSHNYLISVTNPETGVTTYGRDIAGNMTTKKVGTSGLTSYTYDALDRLVKTTYPSATPAVTNTYNKDSKLLTSTASGGNRSFAYDAAGNLIQESLALDGRFFTAKYAYDGNDQLSSITYPQSGRVVSYSPDALGRPTTVSGYVTNVKYWPSGLIQSITYSSGAVSTYGQNARLWPSSFSTLRTGTAGVYLSSTYTYDGVGNLTSIKDAADSNFNRTLGYDNINRLTSAVGFWGQGSISYDGGGNLTKQTLGQSSLAYTYDTSNRLSSVSGLRASTFGYDAYGNVSSSQGNTYSYNDVPNLICINCAVPAKKVEYSYDGLNHRSAVTKASGKVYEMHDSNGKPLIELDGGTLTEYLYLGDKRIAQRVSP
ncbi:RHS repeat protein [Pseudomonas kielensis]|uniref:RHS repeat protein n=1 Tax=Pseudomonas kielensis TaxID=2762577 RepID=UPI0038A9D888